MALQFGIFDHLDDNGIPLADLFETRLKLIEQYDRAGFRSYHIAEHHSTPLGMAPSPSVFLLRGAADQAVTLRPAALCHADVPSTARRRRSGDARSYEPRAAGIGPGTRRVADRNRKLRRRAGAAPAMNREATEVILKALAADMLNHDGKFYRYKNVRIAAKPLQQPHPPLWFAPTEASRAADAAKLKGNIVTLVPEPASRRSPMRIARHGRRKATAADMPLMGVFRHVVVAESDTPRRATSRARLSPMAPPHGVPVGMGRHPLPDRHDLSG